MKRNRVVVLIIIALVAVTALAAVIHLTTRVSVPEGVLLVETAGQTKEVAWGRLELMSVQGTLINGKGEERTIDAQGILLRDMLEGIGASVETEVTVIAEDEYSASVTAEEIKADGQVYLAATDDGGIQLVVFGDSNSKRNVSGVARLVVS